MDRLDGDALFEAIEETETKSDSVEQKNAREGIRYASIATVVLCVVLFLLELLVAKRWEFGKPAILVTFAGIMDVYEGKTNPKRSLLLRGVIELVIAAILLLLFVGFLFI